MTARVHIHKEFSFNFVFGPFCQTSNGQLLSSNVIIVCWMPMTTTSNRIVATMAKWPFRFIAWHLLNARPSTYFSFGGGGKPAGLLGGVFSFSITANGASGGGNWQALSGSITYNFSCKSPYTMWSLSAYAVQHGTRTPPPLPPAHKRAHTKIVITEITRKQEKV